MAETIPGLLTRRAAADPGRTAIIVAGGDSLSFGDWARRATSIAAGLHDRGVGRGDRVGLLFDEPDWIGYAVAYCGVLAAGGVAVPISARTPAGAVRDLLRGCAAAGLVHGPGVAVPETDGWVSTLDTLTGEAPRPVRAGPDDLAQILFTSGTTGRPKGVSATHANLTYGYDTRMRRRPLAHSRHFLHAFPIGTNAAQTMLYNAVVAEPAALIMPRFDAEEFCALIESYRVGTAFLVPAMAIDLMNGGAAARYDLSSVRLLGSTAAALPPEVARSLAAAFGTADVVNYYSSTEAAPAQTVMIFDPDRPAAVGLPEPDELRIADDAGNPVPAGETGEVWLRVPTAPRAYFGDPAASAEVFRDGWVRMGDLGYLDEDGYLYLVDRDRDVIKSGAVKISTLRIEAELYAHPDVAEAAAVGLPHPVMGAMPAAAVVPRRPVSPDDLRAFLTPRLARHEVPTRIVLLDSLPRNDAGKVIKRELRARFADPVPTRPQAPEVPVDSAVSTVEAALRRLWARVLGLREVAAGADFFALGGDSFAAARLAAVAADEFAVELPVSFAFDVPGLSAQAKEIDARRGSGAAASGPSLSRTGGVPLSAQQEYFLRWIHETPQPRAVSAVAVALRIRDRLDVSVLRRALVELTDRHEALRTVFPEPSSAAVLPERAPDFVRMEAKDHAEAVRLARAELERPFDLAAGPLVRALLVGLGPADHVLVLGVHHLVFDGHSMGVLLRELAAGYAGLTSGREYQVDPPLPASEVSAWARARWPRAREFWGPALAGAPPALPNAPGRRPANRFTGRSYPIRVPAEQTRAVRNLTTDGGATVYMGMLAAWAAVLADWADAPEVVVMSPVPGRSRPEFDAVIGCLVQSLLLRIDLADRPAYPELLIRVRRAVLDAAEHQYYPYEEFSRAIPHPAWFRFERWAGPAHLPGLESEPVELPRELMFDWPLPPGEVDLSVPELALTEHPDGTMTGALVYNEHAFTRRTVKRLARRFMNYLGDPR